MSAASVATGRHAPTSRRPVGEKTGEALRMPFGPGRWTTNEQLQLCGRCHRLPAMISPGAIRVDNPTLVRHQPVGMVQSACFKAEQPRSQLRDVPRPPRASVIGSGQLRARLPFLPRGEPGTPCGVSPRSGCIDCHMPRRDVTRGMMMTDHWIRIIPGSRIQRPRTAAGKSPITEP